MCFSSGRFRRFGSSILLETANNVQVSIIKIMKTQTNLRKLSWLLLICFVSALTLSACKHTDEHPSKEHPKKEHPATNAPPRNP